MQSYERASERHVSRRLIKLAGWLAGAAGGPVRRWKGGAWCERELHGVRRRSPANEMHEAHLGECRRSASWGLLRAASKASCLILRHQRKSLESGETLDDAFWRPLDPTE